MFVTLLAATIALTPAGPASAPVPGCITMNLDHLPLGTIPCPTSCAFTASV